MVHSTFQAKILAEPSQERQQSAPGPICNLAGWLWPWMRHELSLGLQLKGTKGSWAMR